MANEGVFRFVANRPATLLTDESKQVVHAGHDVATDVKNAPDGSLFEALETARAAGATRIQLVGIVAAFKNSARYAHQLADLELNPIPLLEWLRDHARKRLETLDVPQVSENLFGVTLEKLIDSDRFKTTFERALETVASDSIIPRRDRQTRDDFSTALKLLHFLRLVNDDESVARTTTTLGDTILQIIVVLPRVIDFRDVPNDRRKPRPPEPPPRKPDDRNRKKLGALIQARDEIASLAITNRALITVQLDEGPRVPPGVEARQGPREELRKPAVDENPRIDVVSNTEPIPKREPRLRADVVEQLKPLTKASLRELKIDLKEVNPFDAVRELEIAIRDTGALVVSNRESPTVLLFGNAMIDSQRFKDTMSPRGSSAKFVPNPMAANCTFMSGVGDLLVVRQTLKAYEVGEFAHVENVLAGETRERSHRRLNVREEITEVETEQEIEKERDLQSTERNELQTEADKTVKSEFQLSAGLQVSGSYGPSISFSANMNASFSTSTEESTKKSVSYSRDVTERSTEKVRQRTRELRRRRLLEEIEERNLHRFENSGTKHTRGIYRWLNKLFDAQIFRYGQRMMFEFVVPEPAAFFLYAMIDNPPQDVELVKPLPPTFNGRPLRPANLQLSNYQDYIAQYGVTTAPAPPSAFVMSSVFDKQDGNSANNIGRASKVTIPDGYEAYAAMVATDNIFTEGKPRGFRIMIGGENINHDAVWGSDLRYFNRKYRGEIAYASTLMNAWAFALGIDVFCSLTTEGFTKWQHQVYDAILEAYQAQKSTYDEKINAAQIEHGTPTLGRNPLENVTLAREELKKLVVEMLIDDAHLDINDFEPGAEPFIVPDKVCDDGSFVRFFENAFEWHNLLYVFYSYFWGRHARWISAIHLTDADPEFAAFLKAGAARVQVPVRPGFERAITHFCQFGEIWEGNDPPVIDDDLYVPIVDEISEHLGKLDEGTPYPEGSKPWTVTLPTDLIVVQDLDEISSIVDIMTGQPINLGGA